MNALGLQAAATAPSKNEDPGPLIKGLGFRV